MHAPSQQPHLEVLRQRVVISAGQILVGRLQDRAQVDRRGAHSRGCVHQRTKGGCAERARQELQFLCERKGQRETGELVKL